MAGTIAHVETANWQTEVVASSTPVLVDFWAEWCGPCKALAPTLEELNKELGGKLKILKVNVDQSPELAGQYGIRSIPTLLLFKNGKVEQQMVGNMSKAALKAKLDPYVG